MRFLLLVIIHSVLAEDTFVESIVSDITTNHYVGETVIWSCKLSDDASGNRWRRACSIIATSSNITLADPEGKHFNVVEDEEQDKYNLEIYNVTELDSGLYWCEMQRDGQITQQRVTLFVLERRTTELITETMTTRNNSNKTVENTDPGEAETVTNSGLSCQEKFYHGLLSAGLILISFLLVICSACFNRKCRIKTLEQR